MNVCIVCSVEFKPKRHTTGKWCSRRCAWVSRGGADFNARIARESAQKRSDAPRRPTAGYRKVRGRHEHRVVAEKMLGRALLRGEVVHHLDGNKSNNTPANLRVMTQREHMMEHGLGVPGVAPKHAPWNARWGTK